MNSVTAQPFCVPSNSDVRCDRDPGLRIELRRFWTLDWSRPRVFAQFVVVAVGCFEIEPSVAVGATLDFCEPIGALCGEFGVRGDDVVDAVLAQVPVPKD